MKAGPLRTWGTCDKTSGWYNRPLSPNRRFLIIGGALWPARPVPSPLLTIDALPGRALPQPVAGGLAADGVNRPYVRIHRSMQRQQHTDKHESASIEHPFAG